LDYNFYIATAASSPLATEVFPLNWLECALVDEHEKDQQFYRRKFQGSLTFGGKKLCADFNLFYDYEQINPCEEIYFMIFKDGVLWWEGYFSTSEGSWDLDAQTFTVTPIVIDDYSAWDERGDLEQNIINIPTEVTVNCNGYDYTHNRWLMDVIEYICDSVFDGCTVASNFFTYATDYVTLKPSKLLYLTIAQKSDIKNPLSSDPATVAIMTFNDLMHILRIFNCRWTFDLTTNIIRIEHVSYWDHIAGLDLRTQEIALSSNKYKYTKDRMTKYESYSWMEAESADFIGDLIWYDDLCVNQDPNSNVEEYFYNITTEIELIQDDPDSISNDGFVILANYKSGANYYTYQFGGIRDTVVRWNMPMSWSYLFQCYFRHDRVLLDGYMNFIATTFVSARKTKVQEINAILCSEYDPENYITTELGETYFGGLKGYVDKAVIHPYGEVNFTLLYGPEDNVNSGIGDDSKALAVIQDELDIWSYLSEPNIYDTYYSVWTNDDTCDVITIPAGTTYQHDTLTQINPIVTSKFNFTDSSLTGWDKTVNGGTTYLTCTDGDCDSGAPVPPAVPDIPDIIGHSQASTCGPIHLSWTSEADATYYVLQRNPDLGGNAAWQTQYTGAALMYDDYDAGVQDGVTFLYRVAAGNITGLSDWSAEHTVDDVMC
jgi:hypothetical protein